MSMPRKDDNAYKIVVGILKEEDLLMDLDINV
jgi:hypothetical protein